MPNKRSHIAFALSLVAGLLLIVSGTHGPIGIFQLILQKLPMLIENNILLSIAGAIVLFLIIMSLLGGFLVIVGGYLIIKRHSTTGKMAIGLGAGVGIPWLILILFTLATSQDPSLVLAQHNIVGWIGIITALAARFIAK